MRKNILILILIISIILCFIIIFLGIKIGNLTLINSYKNVEELSAQKKELLSELNYKNTKEYEEKKYKLEESIKNYKDIKGIYDNKVLSGEITDDNLYNVQDIENLYLTIENYAKQKGVTLNLDVLKNSTETTISTEYIICDLKFRVTGEYISITDFLYSIEGDDNLHFEISNFTLEKSGNDLQASFDVKKVPINSNNV